ncbi:MAG: F-type H+-transporting ATPase subunit delta [Cyclobacteriaceae bacterium]|jgi:F-type H+-transporting ATPase subunit delta
MSTAKISNRYAKPLLELAEEQKVLDNVFADMTNFSKICKENRDFLLMLRSPIISHLKKADILSKIFKGKVDKLTSSFLELVAKKSREKLLPDIAESFVELYNEKKGFQEAVVTTSIALDEVTRKAFEQLVTEITGKKPLLKEVVNADLIGGYILKLGDRQLDDSVSGKLQDLKLRFQKENL